MDGPWDTFFGGDVEVLDALYLHRYLFMEADAGTGSDGDQTIYFYEANSRTGEYIRWDDSANAFRITDDIWLGKETDNIGFRVFNNYDISFRHDQNNDDADSWFRVFTNASLIEQMRIEDGDEAATKFDGVVTSNGLDYAEAYRIDDPTLVAGEVVSLQLSKAGYIRRSAGAYDAYAIGVISAKPGFVTGNSFDAEEGADAAEASLRAAAVARKDEKAEAHTLRLQEALKDQQRDVALLGRVPVKVDGGFGRDPGRGPSDLRPHAGHGHGDERTGSQHRDCALRTGRAAARGASWR